MPSAIANAGKRQRSSAPEGAFVSAPLLVTQSQSNSKPAGSAPPNLATVELRSRSLRYRPRTHSKPKQSNSTLGRLVRQTRAAIAPAARSDPDLPAPALIQNG